MTIWKFILLLFTLAALFGIPMYLYERYIGWKSSREAIKLRNERNRLVDRIAKLEADYTTRASFKDRGFMLPEQEEQLRAMWERVDEISAKANRLDSPLWTAVPRNHAASV